MQEKNEKISGIMADDDKVGPNIDSLIKNLMVEIAKESVEDIRKQAILSRTQKLELSNEDDHDIDKEITELESLIKRLQDEIVEMSETTNKQLPSYPGFSDIEESSASYNDASQVSPEISNKEEPESFEPESCPIISKDEDGMLEKQVEMFGENISNIIKPSNNTNEQENDLDDVRQNFNVQNLDLTDKPRETFSSKLSTAFNLFILPSSLENNKLMLINNIPIESIKSSSNNAPIEQSENVSEFCEGARPNDGDTLNYTRDDDKKISAENNLPGDSIDYDDISRSVNEAVPDNTINNVPIVLNAENPYNLPGNIENHLSTNTTVPKDTIITLLKPETVEAAKTTIMKTLQNVTSSDNTCFPEPSQVIPLETPTDTSEIMQTQSVTRENAILKTDSIFKSFNRKIRKIVGRDTESSISKENHKSEDLSDNDFSEELRRAFPRSKSEPSKNFYTSDDDSSIVDLKNMVALSQDSPENVIKGVSDTINTKNSKTPNSETSNIQATERSNEMINIVKTIIPKFAYDLIIDNTNKSKSVNENPADTTTTTASLSTKSDPPSENIFQIQLVENKPVLTSINKEMLVNTSNTPAVPDLSKKNPEDDEVGSTSITSSITAALPKFFSSNLETDEQQENVMKAEVKIVQDVQENKVEKDVEDAAVEDEDDDDGDDDEEKEDDEDDDDNTYDVD